MVDIQVIETIWTRAVVAQSENTSMIFVALPTGRNGIVHDHILAQRVSGQLAQFQ